MVSRGLLDEPVAAAPEETGLLRELDEVLGAEDGERAYLVSSHGRKIELPGSVFGVLARVVHEMARGNAVSVVPVGMLLTTQQAADLLDVSRPYLVGLLESGQIPFHKVGTHRRVRFEDLMAYKRVSDAKRREALLELTREAERLGIEY